MTSDRLREAADRLDEWNVDNWPDLAVMVPAAAALLRAAADLPGWWSPFDAAAEADLAVLRVLVRLADGGDVAYPSDAVRAAALALADTILGVDGE